MNLLGRSIPVLLNQGMALLIGLGGVALLTRLVPTEVNGFYQVYFLSLCQLGTLLTHPGIVNHASRYWRREAGRSGMYAQFLWRESWRKTPVVLVLVATILGFVGWREGQWSWVLAIPLAAFCNIVLAIQATANLAINVEEKHWLLLILNLVASSARMGLPLLMAVAFGASFLGLGFGFALHCLLLAGLFAMAMSKWPKHRDEELLQSWRTELIAYGRPFVWLGVGNWMLQFADRWLISLLIGESVAGLFATAGNLSGYVPNVLLGALMQMVFPAVFRAADAARDEADWRRIAGQCDRWTLIFSAVSMGGLMMLSYAGPRWMGPLLGRDYSASWGMVFASGLAAMTLQINQFHYLLLQGQHNSTGMVRVMLSVAGLKTLGSVLTLAVSWELFTLWLCLSMPLCGWLGRFMIHRMVFAKSRNPQFPEGAHG